MTYQYATAGNFTIFILVDESDSTGMGCAEWGIQEESCPNCSSYCIVTHMLDDTIQSGIHLVNAIETIHSTEKIKGQTQAEYRAGNTIYLQPGFVSEAGTDFLAKIESCTPSSLEEEIDTAIETFKEETKHLSLIHI